MVKKNGIYKCMHCGNVVEVIEARDVDILCCGEPMTLMQAKTEDEGLEKHVPVVEVAGNKVKVTVGSVEHPMEEKHFIELIELMRGDEVVASARLSPGDKPVAEFCLENTDGITAREYCNIHGLWKS